MASASELLVALKFWEEYPYNLGECRRAIRMIDRQREQVRLCCEDSLVSVPVVGFCMPLRPGSIPVQGFQFCPLSLPRSEVERAFSQVWILDEGRPGEACLVPAQLWSTGDRNTVTEIEIHEAVLIELHQSAERLLGPELERRGMDSSALAASGRVCRAVSARVVDAEGRHDCSAPKTHWPSAAADVLNTLHPTDLAAVVEAERYLIRLRTQLESGTPPTGAQEGGKGREKPGRPRMTDRDDRIRDLCKENNLDGQWAELARVATDDPEALKLNKDEPITASMVKKAVRGRRKRGQKPL